MCELIGRKRGTDWRCRVDTYRFEAKRRLIKLEGLLQTQVTTSQFFVNLIKLDFLKALTITKYFTNNRKKRKLNCVAGASYKFVHWINKVSSNF